MKKVVADPVREIDFSGARRGSVVPMDSGKTKLSIRLDTKVIDYFREAADRAGGGNYQTMINQALREFISVEMKPLEDLLRRVVREELSQYKPGES